MPREYRLDPLSGNRSFDAARLSAFLASREGPRGRPRPGLGPLLAIKDETALGVGIANTVILPLLGSASLEARVGVTLVGVSPQIVAKEQMIMLELAARLAHVQLGHARRGWGHVKEVVHFVAAVELKAGRGATGEVLGLIGELSDAQLNVDDRFGRESVNRRRANVVNAKGHCPQALAETTTPHAIEVGPAGVVVDDFDLVAHAHRRDLLETGPDDSKGASRQGLALGERKLLGRDAS